MLRWDGTEVGQDTLPLPAGKQAQSCLGHHSEARTETFRLMEHFAGSGWGAFMGFKPSQGVWQSLSHAGSHINRRPSSTAGCCAVGYTLPQLPWDATATAHGGCCLCSMSPWAAQALLPADFTPAQAACLCHWLCWGKASSGTPGHP